MSETAPVGQPEAALQTAYLNSLDARKRWIEAAAAGVQTSQREQLHAELHAKTLAWWDALRPFLEDRDDMERFWDRVELWPVGVKSRRILYCDACDTGFDPDESLLEVEDGCPKCGQTKVEETAIPQRDENGQVIYEHQRGLKSLEEWIDKTVVVEREVGTFRKKTVTEEQPQRLKPELLLRVGWLLDQAAEKLDLIADVKKEVPVTEVDQDTIDEFRDRIKEVMGEVDEGTGAAAGLEAATDGGED
jgi:hypothetical protein